MLTSSRSVSIHDPQAVLYVSDHLTGAIKRLWTNMHRTWVDGSMAGPLRSGLLGDQRSAPEVASALGATDVVVSKRLHSNGMDFAVGDIFPPRVHCSKPFIVRTLTRSLWCWLDPFAWHEHWDHGHRYVLLTMQGILLLPMLTKRKHLLRIVGPGSQRPRSWSCMQNSSECVCAISSFVR